MRFADEQKRFLAQMLPDGAKQLRIAQVNRAYIASLKRTWPNQADMVRYVLEHTNAVYVRQDTRPKKGAYKDKAYMLCEVCIDDPAVRAEVNAWQELIALNMQIEGLTFDEFHIIPARFGMKKRHPFKNAISKGQKSSTASLSAPKTLQAKSQSSDVRNLQKLKQALCLVFGEATEELLSHINAAFLDAVVSSDDDALSRLHRRYYCQLCTSDDSCRRLLLSQSDAIVGRAREVGLNVCSLTVAPWTGSATAQAFPVCGWPRVIDKPSQETSEHENA